MQKPMSLDAKQSIMQHIVTPCLEEWSEVRLPLNTRIYMKTKRDLAFFSIKSLSHEKHWLG
jgi:hypothetical protein